MFLKIFRFKIKRLLHLHNLLKLAFQRKSLNIPYFHGKTRKPGKPLVQPQYFPVKLAYGI